MVPLPRLFVGGVEAHFLNLVIPGWRATVAKKAGQVPRGSTVSENVGLLQDQKFMLEMTNYRKYHE